YRPVRDPYIHESQAVKSNISQLLLSRIPYPPPALSCGIFRYSHKRKNEVINCTLICSELYAAKFIPGLIEPNLAATPFLKSSNRNLEACNFQ
ncbi:MAG TPA: hypothetical protein VNX68_11085, partial [Nitrosopumilaceae archaeon]|nr:hypothetical protein [Nitrosopumilaceae archaeon]